MGKIKKIIQVKDGVKYSYDGGTNDLATKETAGLVELATSDEVKTGTDDTRAITPKGLKDALTSTDTNPIPDASTTVKGISRFATSEEVDAGTLNNVGISPNEMQRWVKSNTLKPVTKYTTLYIKQDTGVDSIADGTQERPFKSLLTCYKYITSSLGNTSNYSRITIKFLSDYTETATTITFGSTNLSLGVGLTIDGEGFNVILCPLITYSCCIDLKNLTIKYSENNNTFRFCIDVLYSSIVRIYGTVKFVIDVNNTNKGSFVTVMRSIYGAEIALYDGFIIEFNNDISIANTFFCGVNGSVSLYGNIYINNSTITLNQIINLISNGRFSIGNYNISGTSNIIGQKYFLNYKSHLILNGRGNEVINLGSKAGETVNDSLVY